LFDDFPSQKITKSRVPRGKSRRSEDRQPGILRAECA
jgi:hypothetical protein